MIAIAKQIDVCETEAVHPPRILSLAYGEAIARLIKEGPGLATMDQWQLADVIAEVASEIGEALVDLPHRTVGVATSRAARDLITLIRAAMAAGRADP